MNAPTRAALPFLGPAVAVLALLLVFPLLRTVWLSLLRFDLSQVLGRAPHFVGLANYAELARSGFFWHVVVATLVFAAVCVIGTLVLGTACALALEEPFWGRAPLRVAIVLPWAMPAVAASIVWKWMFDDQHGPIDAALAALGLRSFDGFSWTSNAYVAFAAVALIVIWQTFPFVTLTLLAGFATLPRSLYEASAVDGVSEWRRTFGITLPYLRTLFITLVVLLLIWDVKVFTQVYVMTGGGPARATYVLGLFAWREGFANVRLGSAAALATVMSILLAFLVAIYLRVTRSEAA